MICKICNKKIDPIKKKHKNHKYIFCSKKCHAKSQFTKHGESKTKFYGRWRGIFRRCNDNKFKCYHNYGGRGIKCLWNTFEEFKKDMYDSYIKHCEKFGENNTQIDRINNDDNYYKENCKWATFFEQSKNKQNTIFLTHNSITKSLIEWAKIKGIRRGTLYQRYVRGNDIFKDF